MKPRTKAFLIHLAASAITLIPLLILIFLFWYPSPLFAYQGGHTALLTLALLHAVAAPALTLLLYRPGKKGLWFDMVTVAVLQIGALTYGTHALWSQRPLVLAFAVDAYFVVTAAQVDASAIPPALWQARPLAGPLPVYAAPVDDPEHVFRVLFEGAPDIHLLPMQYRPLAPHLDILERRHQDLGILARSRPTVAAAIADINPDWLHDTWALPIHGRRLSGTVLVDRQTGKPRHYLAFDLSAEMDRIRQETRPAKAPAIPGFRTSDQTAE